MRALVYSNVYIALAAVLFAQTSYLLVGADPGLTGVHALVFFATLAVYNFDRLVSASHEDQVHLSSRHRWIAEHRRALWGVAGVSAAGVAIALTRLQAEALVALAPLALLTMCYSLPIVLRSKGDLRLKDIAGLKIFLIAGVWAGATGLLPALDAGLAADSPSLWLLFAERFLFVFAITLPFDIRDLERDRAAGIHTIPQRIGPTATRWLAVGLLGGFVGVGAWHYGIGVDGPLGPLAASAATTAVLVALARQQRHPLYFVGALDGTMILQWVFVVGWSLLR